MITPESMTLTKKTISRIILECAKPAAIPIEASAPPPAVDRCWAMGPHEADVNALLTALNLALVAAPIDATVAQRTQTTNTNITAYSTAVGPPSSIKKRRIRCDDWHIWCSSFKSNGGGTVGPPRRLTPTLAKKRTDGRHFIPGSGLAQPGR
jgi:hypothetical protein